MDFDESCRDTKQVCRGTKQLSKTQLCFCDQKHNYQLQKSYLWLLPGWVGKEAGRQVGERGVRMGLKRGPPLICKVLFYFFCNKMIWKTKAFLCILGWTYLVMANASVNYYWISCYRFISSSSSSAVAFCCVLCFTVFFRTGFLGSTVLVTWVRELSMCLSNRERLGKLWEPSVAGDGNSTAE